MIKILKKKNNITFRTLIIENDKQARFRLIKLLLNYPDQIENIGFARNGKNGLEKINQLKPSLICLDIQMPGMNGFEMLSKLKRIPLFIFRNA